MTIFQLKQKRSRILANLGDYINSPNSEDQAAAIVAKNELAEINAQLRWLNVPKQKQGSKKEQAQGLLFN